MNVELIVRLALSGCNKTLDRLKVNCFPMVWTIIFNGLGRYRFSLARWQASTNPEPPLPKS